LYGKFTEDTRDTSACLSLPPQLLQDAEHPAEKFLSYMKFIRKWGKMGNFTYGAIV
jgi:hypothetical protein